MIRTTAIPTTHNTEYVEMHAAVAPSRLAGMVCPVGANDTETVPRAPALSRRQKFLAGYTWLVLKNVIGWTLIVASFVAGPLVPGPGGIPLFLIGFALVSFPGKRRLTARVLRGRQVRFRHGPFVLVSLAVATSASSPSTSRKPSPSCSTSTTTRLRPTRSGASRSAAHPRNRL